MAKLASGQTVLIHGASGGVGGFAVQFAKVKGAKVIATAGKDHLDYVRSLGADEVIDYEAQKFEEVVNDVNVVFDLIGTETQKRSWQVLKAGGILVSTVGITSPEIAAQHEARSAAYMAQPLASLLNEIGGLIDEGRVRVTVQQVLALNEARKAHEIIQEGHVKGKIVLEVLK